MIDAATASRFARTALGHVTQEYPNKLDHVMAGPGDALTPRALHPAFYGSFDWHSCVHSWWTLLTLARLHPALPEGPDIAALADKVLTADNLAAELAYAQRPQSRGFERPYGWAWLLTLHLEASRHEGQGWAAHIAPLARHFAMGWRDYLATLAHPIRTPTHPNTAFAMRLSLDWADSFDAELASLLRAAARRFYGEDRDTREAVAGDAFLSPALVEAALMRRALPPADFAVWLRAFLPRLHEGEPAALFVPARVTDASDGKAAHLDGVNFTRAWCWREMGLGGDLAARHMAASLPAVDGDYMGSHWLASFALLAMLAGKGDD
ncbi:DUF2891 family protein [Erythrobacter arachoides]|uniref:DUF2891 family protein n=1 Tax=Aurantiacibacter arachoides TaxID=1850444 RepID=A0A845A9F7_9SPHN|nr:DUF2891 domain-containing protein [Aurantiacibacter arachoides]MXO94209.1 DUF2891 family protein [Aurantiacibacter arachoides]GGD65248.1 hypothetical protein GCM10011411_26980 [Aurantiacibacter arachoides]